MKDLGCRSLSYLVSVVISRTEKDTPSDNCTSISWLRGLAGYQKFKKRTVLPQSLAVAMSISHVDHAKALPGKAILESHSPKSSNESDD